MQVKIWFQNRRTKWKKHENITATDINDQKLQNEKNPDVAKAIQNAAKLKKAKERSEQSNHAAVNSDIRTNSNNNGFPETLSGNRLTADDTNELPLCLVQDKTKNLPENPELNTAVTVSQYDRLHVHGELQAVQNINDDCKPTETKVQKQYHIDKLVSDSEIIRVSTLEIESGEMVD